MVLLCLNTFSGQSLKIEISWNRNFLEFKFLGNINDLPQSSSNIVFYLFADDTNIYFEAENLNLLQHTVNKELKKLKDVNNVSLNIDKTNFIIFKSPQHFPSDIINIKIGNLPVKETCYVKFLGVL